LFHSINLETICCCFLLLFVLMVRWSTEPKSVIISIVLSQSNRYVVGEQEEKKRQSIVLRKDWKSVITACSSCTNPLFFIQLLMFYLLLFKYFISTSRFDCLTDWISRPSMSTLYLHLLSLSLSLSLLYTLGNDD
jgi:hypothetical protein